MCTSYIGFGFGIVIGLFATVRITRICIYIIYLCWVCVCVRKYMWQDESFYWNAMGPKWVWVLIVTSSKLIELYGNDMTVIICHFVCNLIAHPNMISFAYPKWKHRSSLSLSICVCASICDGFKLIQDVNCITHATVKITRN